MSGFFIYRNRNLTEIKPLKVHSLQKKQKLSLAGGRARHAKTQTTSVTLIFRMFKG